VPTISDQTVIQPLITGEPINIKIGPFNEAELSKDKKWQSPGSRWYTIRNMENEMSPGRKDASYHSPKKAI